MRNYQSRNWGLMQRLEVEMQTGSYSLDFSLADLTWLEFSLADLTWLEFMVGVLSG